MLVAKKFDSTAVAEAMRRVRAALGSLQDKDEATRVSRVKHWGHRHHEIFRKYVESLIQLDCMNGSVVASSSVMAAMTV